MAQLGHRLLAFWVHITPSIQTPSFPRKYFQSIRAILRDSPCLSLCLTKSLCRWFWGGCHRQLAPLATWGTLSLPSSRGGRRSAPGWAGLRAARPGTIWSAVDTLEETDRNIKDKKSWTQSCIWLSLHGSMLVCRQERQPIVRTQILLLSYLSRVTRAVTQSALRGYHHCQNFSFIYGCDIFLSVVSAGNSLSLLGTSWM